MPKHVTSSPKYINYLVRGHAIKPIVNIDFKKSTVNDRYQIKLRGQSKPWRSPRAKPAQQFQAGSLLTTHLSKVVGRLDSDIGILLVVTTSILYDNTLVQNVVCLYSDTSIQYCI